MSVSSEAKLMLVNSLKGRHNPDVVDIIIQAPAHAMKLHFIIYQNNGGLI